MARERRRPMSPTQAIGRAATRRARPAAAPGTPEGKARALERELGAAEAQRRVGVSGRTWRRWKAGGVPSGRNAAALDAQAEASARRAAISSRREARLRNRGAYVRMAGNMGGGTPGARRKNTRHRSIGDRGEASIHLSGDEMAEILDRWEAGDDEGALEALREAVADEYGWQSLQFEDLTLLEFLRDDPNGRG